MRTKNIVELYKACDDVTQKMEYIKWRSEIPYINFPANWFIKIIPPSHGAVVSFLIKKNNVDKSEGVSVYLDCYDILGYFGEPYWKVFPYNQYIFRCEMQDTTALINAIAHSLEEIKQ